MVGRATPSPFLAFWYAALGSPHGIYLRSPDVVRLKTMLYTARGKALDPSLSTLIVRTSPMRPRDELWIMKTSFDVADEQERDAG